MKVMSTGNRGGEDEDEDGGASQDNVHCYQMKQSNGNDNPLVRLLSHIEQRIQFLWLLLVRNRNQVFKARVPLPFSRLEYIHPDP